jgi:hypothetical protein
MDAADLSGVLVSRYEDAYGSYSYWTLSAIDLSRLTALSGAVSDFAEAMVDSGDIEGILLAVYGDETHDAAWYYGDSSFVDLYDFARLVKAYTGITTKLTP